jgi:ADP-ribose pyrophosphatase YjhB (NUDIX family)
MTGFPSDFFAHCPRCGQPRGEANASAPFRCRQCGFTLYFNAALAAVAFIRDGAGRVLFIRRAKEPARGKLAPPGGFVDIGERAEEALRREVREEVHLELGSLTYLCSEPNTYLYGDVTYPVLDLFFVARADDPAGARAGDDVDAVLWLVPRDVVVDDLAFVSMRQAFTRYLAQALGR